MAHPSPFQAEQRREDEDERRRDIGPSVWMEDMHAVSDVQVIELTGFEDALGALSTSELLPAQRRVYEIIAMHLADTLAGQEPPQLLLQIEGEGGTGKSRVNQTVTQVFARLGRLAKESFTGVAASPVDGKTGFIRKFPAVADRA
ncbi:unnamed protein product [Peniophora sp. CBMAI 1063]|nr:unnamed protein product [Peniophora sp. CBMAI 1063]